VTETLSYVQAIRDYHPDHNRPPILHYPLRRIAYHAEAFLDRQNKDNPGEVRPLDEILSLAEGLDEMERTLESGDYIWPVRAKAEIAEIAHLPLDAELPVALYEQFVLPRQSGSSVLDAIAVQALGLAARANALSHELAKARWLARVADFERMAELALSARELIEAAGRYHHSRDTLRSRQARTGQKGADAKHARNRELKARFFTFYQQGTFPSQREAARQYFNSLGEADQRVITNARDPEAAIRNLTAALREQLRKNG
jgi:hypothetical protein